MKKKNVLFNNIDEELLRKSNVSIKDLLFYNSNNSIINYYKENSNIVLKDDKGIWAPSKYLRIEGILNIENTKIYYNDEKHKVANQDTIIGVAMKIYKNKFTNDVIHLGTFNNADDTVNLSFSKIFEDNELFNMVSISFYLYIYEPSVNCLDLCIANDKGMIIGNLCEETIIIDGMSSELHISLVNKTSSDPLWQLDFEYDNILVDLLHDCYNLRINTNNKDYKYLDTSDINNFNRGFFNEIIVETIIIVISEVFKKDGLNIDDEYEEGSIAQFIDYLKRTILGPECNMEDLNVVSKILRERFLTRGNDD